MNLIPNCSEAICRINIMDLTKQEIRQLTSALRKAGDGSSGNEDRDWSAYDDSQNFQEKEIFGMKLLESYGDFPFNGAELIEEVIKNMEKRFGKKLEWTNEEG